MSKPVTLADRIRYAFDALMAKGFLALLAWHLIISLGVVVTIALVVVLLGMTPLDEAGDPIAFKTLVWTVLMHAIDPGTITGDENGPAWRSIMMVATVGGIMLIGSLVAVLVATVAGVIISLARRSPVGQTELPLAPFLAVASIPALLNLLEFPLH